MSKKAFDLIAEGLNEALGVARGESKPIRLHVPAEIDVKAIRAKLGMTQRDFAWAFGFGVDQVKQWEQGRSRPLEALRAYLLLIQADPAGMMKSLQELKAAEIQEFDAPRRSTK